MFTLIHGNNTFDSYIKLDKFKKEFSSKDFEIKIIDADEIDLKELNIELDFSDGLFAKKKLLILKRLGQNVTAILERFCNFVLNNKENDLVNLVLWEDEVLSKKNKLNEVLKFFQVELFENPKDYEKKNEAQKFALNLAKSFNIPFDSEKTSEFLDLVGYEKFDIYYEMKKFYILQKNNLELDFGILSTNESYNIFEFISTFWNNDYEKFLKILNFTLLDRQLYSLILSLLVNKLITKSENDILKNLIEYDFQFKSGNLEEEDVFILTYHQIQNKIALS